MFRATRLSLKRGAVLVVLLGLLCPLDLRAQSPDLTGIAHVAFRVNDLDKSREFYHTLGFDQAFEFTDAGKISVAYIKVNDRQFIE
ncbi:MAG TPA: VOC family protein [Terriglobales bacterium]|nr:VOC family protein [Terriglobales bacterium]